MWWSFLLGLLVGGYATGFAMVFYIHMDSPATLGLALLRSAVWPVFLTTGWPEGRPLPMD